MVTIGTVNSEKKLFKNVDDGAYQSYKLSGAFDSGKLKRKKIYKIYMTGEG